jgi:hypothetical protein
MTISRSTLLKLSWFGALTTVSVVANQQGLGPAVTGLLAALGAAGGYASDVAKNICAQLLVDAADAADDAETRNARREQNRHVHRLIGEAVARVLEQNAARSGAVGSGRARWPSRTRTRVYSGGARAAALQKPVGDPRAHAPGRCWCGRQQCRWLIAECGLIG